MPDATLFILVAIDDDALVGSWTFRANDELAIAHHLLRHAWDYEHVFARLRISLRRIDQVTPEELLRAIHNSYSNVHCNATFHLIRVPAEEIRQVDPAGTSVQA
jgi:hypothetical protein